MSKIKSNFTIDFMNAWKDNNDIVFIQMELCKDNLNHILEMKPQAFARGKGEKLNSLEFFISCQLLKEVTECLNFLHTSSPPIMHRDLKPANILVTDGQNERFVKLCDFGLSKDYLKSSNTRNLGTGKYIAWESRQSRHYNYKADVFSLAVIALQIFGIEFEKDQESIDWYVAK